MTPSVPGDPLPRSASDAYFHEDYAAQLMLFNIAQTRPTEGSRTFEEHRGHHEKESDMQQAPTFPMLTMPSRPLVAQRGEKQSRYVPAVATDIRKTFDKYRRLMAQQEKK